MANNTASPEVTQNQDSLLEADNASTDNLPPWPKADWKDKLRMSYYVSIVYLPVCILVTLIVSVYPIYIAFYLWPKVVGGDDRPELYYWHSDSEHRLSRIVGSCCFALMTVFITLFLCSFYQAFSTSPGSVPDTEEWRVLEVAEQRRARYFQERKHTNGTIRWCRRCSLVKPDRSHHCRLCDQCVLKMDHHCPWIANCVGFFNYKYFFLMLTYGMLSLWLFEGSFWETALITWRDDERGAGFSFFVTLVYSLMGILLTAVTLFWSFHVYLMLSAMTTIEYCEKHKKDANGKKISPYFRSGYESLQDALGLDPTYWLLPWKYRTESEDGLSFVKIEEAPSMSSESGP